MAAGELSAPWLEPIAHDYALVRESAEAGRWEEVVERLNRLARERAIHNANDRRIVFAPAAAAGDAPYEAHIWRTGEVPTRRGQGGGWHDLFNALVWLSFPATKGRLNRFQAESLAASGVAPRRGVVRDAATLFDESGAVVLTRDPTVRASLCAMRWKELFVQGRAAFRGAARVVVFGHALFDKLRAPYKSICAQAWVIDADPETSDADRILAAAIDASALRPGSFAPLPVLGVPGWWPQNENPAFYDDAGVFRSARARHGPGAILAKSAAAQ
ncbi:MAG: DUF3025 domain-containing protein [Burkholderiaceae bacterium]|nr:DUF3025 domain-containing protein [Burkholderiaceae bacterium]